MPEDIHRVVVQIKAPKGQFPGEVAEGYYVVFENSVVLTDQDGNQFRLSPNIIWDGARMRA